MNILKAIGGLFARLWRWIKETAWVQPLLIVGAIFAIIFSIPRITSWVQSFGIGTSNAYYNQYRVSLNGETMDESYGTAADKLVKTVNDWSNFAGDENYYLTYDEYRAALEKSTDNPLQYGEKYFLVFVEEECTACDTAKPGFSTLQDNWNTSYVTVESKKSKTLLPFKMHTIYADEASDNDSDYEIEEQKKAFVRFLEKFHNNDFFERAGGRLSEETPYRSNAGLESNSNYDYFTNADTTNFSTPTILLIDYSEEAFDLGRPGVSEVLFGVSGDGDYAKATLLLNMWNHTEGSSSNPFCEQYRA